MAFFGGKSIVDAFTAANTKAEVSVIQVNLLSMADHACRSEHGFKTSPTTQVTLELWLSISKA